MSSEQALERLMRSAEREKERDRTEAQRLKLLNEAFLKPTKIIEEFRSYMGRMRAQLHTASEQLMESMREKHKLEEQQRALGRNPDKELQLLIDATEQEVQANRAMRDMHSGHIDEADRQRLKDLKVAYAEIEALGGKLKLTLAKPPAAPVPAVAMEDEL